MSKPKSDDGGPAFPVLAYDHSIAGDIRLQPTIYDGMSLRDYFAGQWLAGLGACEECVIGEDAVADGCYRIADAMLKRRNQP